MSDPRWPAVHIIKTVEHEGRTYRVPVTSPVCDLCGDEGPAWDYDCEDFVIPDVDASSGGWAACTPCSDLIEAEDWDGLLERAVSAGRAHGMTVGERMIAHMRLMHAGFRRFRYGERRAWG